MAYKYYTLRQAKFHKSKIKPFPFVIAHECMEKYKDSATGEMRLKTREFFAFDDVEIYLEMRDEYPHAHEVIFDRFSDTQQGRLMFDFDFDEPWNGVKPHFVPKDFQKDIERFIYLTFEKYYDNVDTKKFVFVWLISDVTKKWSKHLIVKNAFFAEDWKEQIQLFYQLLLGMIKDAKIFNYPADKLIDIQVARNNATMRMCGASKMNGKVLRLESPKDANFYDTLVQLYRRCDIKCEQHIYQDQIKKDLLDEMFFEKPMQTNAHYKQACLYANIDLTRPDYRFGNQKLPEYIIKQSFEDFEEFYKAHFKVSRQDVFHIVSVTGSIINLGRERSAPCILSGRVHEAENAFLIVNDSEYGKRKLNFFCRRGCTFHGNKSREISIRDDFIIKGLD